MKNLLKGIVVTFGMFSKIPMPEVEWDKDSLKYVYAFLPLVGVVLGFAEYLWHALALKMGIQPLFYAAVAVAVLVWITGGIHLDGFADSWDAISSYGDREKRLAILKDPHIGAFGVIHLIVYIALLVGIFSQLYQYEVKACMFIAVFALSRGVAGLIGEGGKSAKADGLKTTFAPTENEKRNTLPMALVIIAMSAVILYSSVPAGLLSLAIQGGFVLYFWGYADKNFGGFTGDLLGFVICISELIGLFAITFGGIVN